MSDAPDPLDGLSELAACDLRLARRFAARIEALPDDADDQAMRLARAYQRMARSYRQTLALQLRLRRDLKADAKADAQDARKRRRDAVFQRQRAIKARVTSLIYDEREDETEGDELYGQLLEFLDLAAKRPDFFETPVDTHVAALAQALGLSAPHVSPACGGKRRATPQERGGDGGSQTKPPEPILFNGRLAPPMDLPSWLTDDDTS
jgi:hypothetical protein